MTIKTPSPPPALKMSKPATPTANIVTPTMAKPGKEGDIIAICGVEGSGKTSMSAFAPSPLMITCEQETGYQTLLRAGSVPAVPHMHFDDWSTAIQSLNALDTSPFKTIHIDCADAMERMGKVYVCDRECGGDWDKYHAFGRGNEALASEWLHFMSALNRLRKGGAHVVLLVHAQVKRFNEPGTEGYDIYQGNLTRKVYEASYGRIDHWLFMNFKTAEVDGGRTIQVRNLYTQRTASWIAKNRLKGIPPVLRMPDDPAKMWPAIAQYLPGGAG